MCLCKITATDNTLVYYVKGMLLKLSEKDPRSGGKSVNVTCPKFKILGPNFAIYTLFYPADLVVTEF